MMISPDGYKKEHESETLEQLVLERTKLFNEIVEYEKKHIMNDIPFSPDEIVKPSPEVVYNMHNLYLKEITDLIIEKEKNSDELNENNESERNFYKKNDNDIIWWVEKTDSIGEHLFSFDKKKIYNLFKDYPYELSKEEKEIFDKENPYWADFFKDRNTQNKKDENSNKKTCFIITMSNWGMIGPNSITGNEFIIYDDLSIDLKISKNNSLGTEKEISTLHGTITQEKYDEIVKNINEAKENFYDVHATDGNAWSFEEYANDKLVWKRELGYIYGIIPLTNITSILNSIDYK